MNITVIYHSKDYDGIACREIAQYFLSRQGHKVTCIGWDYGEPEPEVKGADFIFVLDVSLDGLFARRETYHRIFWIDHHKTALEKWKDATMGGYRIDGVAACRLCWQWFANPAPLGNSGTSPAATKEDYINRRVVEPDLVRLLGEYDVWDHRDQDAATLQYGLRATPEFSFQHYFDERCDQADQLGILLGRGEVVKTYQKDQDENLCKSRAHVFNWRGWRWVGLNASGNSLTFAWAEERYLPDALLMWKFDGREVLVSLYGSKVRPDLDLSPIAQEHGGGGHRQACGFRCSLRELGEILMAPGI